MLSVFEFVEYGFDMFLLAFMWVCRGHKWRKMKRHSGKISDATPKPNDENAAQERAPEGSADVNHINDKAATGRNTPARGLRPGKRPGMRSASGVRKLRPHSRASAFPQFDAGGVPPNRQNYYGRQQRTARY